MKRILITAAEQDEIISAQQAFMQCVKKLEEYVEVDFMLTGIGVASTCYRLTKKILESNSQGKSYDLVINIGIAGSYDFTNGPGATAMFPMGSVAIIEKEYFGDLGFETLCGFQTLFQHELLDADMFPFKGGALHRVSLDERTEKFMDRFGKGIGVTVQTVTGTQERKNELMEQFSPHIESMEGAAVYYVCLLENVPFFELRAVSNEVGEKNRGKWNIPLALENLKQAMYNFFLDACL